MKGTWNGKEKKLALFIGDTIIHVENLNKLTKKTPPGTKQQLSRVNTQKSIIFLYTSN